MFNISVSVVFVVNGGFVSFIFVQLVALFVSIVFLEVGGDKYLSLGDLFSIFVIIEFNIIVLSWGGFSFNLVVNWNGGGGISINVGGIEWNSLGSSGFGMNWVSGGISNIMGMIFNWNFFLSVNNFMVLFNLGL